MDFKQLESYATKIGIYSLLLLTLIGFLLVFDLAFDLNILPGQTLKTAAGVFASMLFVLSCSSVLISIMLNIKHIVVLIEAQIEEKEQDKGQENIPD